MIEILKTFDLTLLDAEMIIVWTFCFLILWQVMSAWCWKPMLALLEAREAATVGAQAKVALLNQEAEELGRIFENEILKARVDAVKTKSAMVVDAKSKAQTLISQAEQQASLAAKQAAEDSRMSAEKVEKELQGQITALSQQALAKMGIQ